MHGIVGAVNMWPSIIAIGVILVLGSVALRALSPPRVDGRPSPQRWVPVTALIAGPIIAASGWAAHVFVLSAESYISATERFEMLPSLLWIGVIAGVISAVAFAIAYRIRPPKGR